MMTKILYLYSECSYFSKVDEVAKAFLSRQAFVFYLLNYINNAIINSTTNKKNRNLEIVAAPLAILVNPKIAATTATIKNTIAQPNIIKGF